MAQDKVLAPVRTDHANSRGRLHPEPESGTRTAFQRDRDRIIHSGAFRRLKHKTQVFVYHEGDYYRTRLTHSIEVAQIARSVSRALGLDEDLAEALALAHDLGHTPFGHAGEEVLNRKMAGQGGFDHNAQTLRVLTKLEARYAEFDGLNLTWECLEGVVKHNGPLAGGDVPSAIAEYCGQQDLELSSWPGAEAQVAAMADDIAYNNHDIDDGLRAGLFRIEDLLDVPLVGPIINEITATYPDLARSRLIHETVRRMIGAMVEDLLAESVRRFQSDRPGNVEDVRWLGRPLVTFSQTMQQHDKALKDFLRQHMYRHYKVNRMTSKARRVVAELFDLYVAEPECLPGEWQAQIKQAGQDQTGRVVTDFIAGMTDRYALEQHSRLFDISSQV